MNPLRYALTGIQNQLGAVPRPAWCTYLVTYRCNARCGMCDSWRMKPGAELTVEQVRTIFTKLAPLDVVRLSGGEPFLRTDFAELATAVLEAGRPAILHITTNGSFPDRVAEFVERFPKPRRLRLMVSFDGLAPTHDANRGAAVRFETAFETVRRLAALRDGLGVEVSANHTVIAPESLADAAELRAKLTALGCDVHSVLAYADSAMYGAKRRGQRAEDLLSARYPLHPKLAEADVSGFVDHELAALGALRIWWLRWGKRYYLRGLRQRLNGQAEVARRPRCVALRSHLRLLPDGRVPVCQFNTQTVGNLLTQSLAEVWHNPAADRQRRWVDACTGCWAECEVVPNALYSGDILRP
jgi:MoaA/NifB/PqqE/SkfB family radical SAM enzyme